MTGLAFLLTPARGSFLRVFEGEGVSPDFEADPPWSLATHVLAGSGSALAIKVSPGVGAKISRVIEWGRGVCVEWVYMTLTFFPWVTEEGMSPGIRVKSAQRLRCCYLGPQMCSHFEC